jgi:membrane protease YdiL (CAAX protease family)
LRPSSNLEASTKTAVVGILQVIGYLIVFLAITVGLMGATKIFVGDWEAGGPLLALFGEGLLTVLGIAVTNLVIFLMARSSGVFRGWPGVGAGAIWFAKGALLGLAMAGLMLVNTMALGGARLVIDEQVLLHYVAYVARLGGCLLIAALAEEWLFRGFPLTRLADVLGRGWANLAVALLFALAHFGSSGFNALVLVNIVLGSLVVGAVRFTPGGLPAAWGFHFGWNFTQVMCGANLSLEDIDVPGVTCAAAGSTLVSGGTFGPEAGIGATIATVAVLAFLIRWFRRRQSLTAPFPFGLGG